MIYAPTFYSERLKWVARFVLLLPFLTCAVIFIALNNLSAATPTEVQNGITSTKSPKNTSTLYNIRAQAQQSGWTSQLHMQAGELYYKVGDFNNTIAHWEAAELTDATTIQRLADIYIQMHQWTSATDKLTKLIDMKNNHSWANYHLGLIKSPIDPSGAIPFLRIASRVPQYSDVAVDILEVVESHAANPLASIYVGQAFAAKNLWPYAEYAFRHAAIISNPYPEALAYLGLSRIQQGKDGTVWIEQALTLGENSAEVHYIYGLYLRHLEQLKESQHAFIQATLLDPSNPAYYAELGFATQLLRNYDEAAHWFRIAVDVSNDAPEFQQILTSYYVQAGINLSPNNLPFLQEIIEDIHSEDPSLYAKLGWSLFTLGDTAGGLNQIDTALTLDPESEIALYYKAYILIDSGDFESAEPYVIQLTEATDIFYRDWAIQQLEGKTDG